MLVLESILANFTTVIASPFKLRSLQHETFILFYFIFQIPFASSLLTTKMFIFMCRHERAKKKSVSKEN